MCSLYPAASFLSAFDMDCHLLLQADLLRSAAVSGLGTPPLSPSALGGVPIGELVVIQLHMHIHKLVPIRGLWCHWLSSVILSFKGPLFCILGHWDNRFDVCMQMHACIVFIVCFMV